MNKLQLLVNIFPALLRTVWEAMSMSAAMARAMATATGMGREDVQHLRFIQYGS